MAAACALNICTVFIALLYQVEPCYLPVSIQVPVPETVPAGYVISQVEFDDCDAASLRLSSSDPNFAARGGRIEALTAVEVTAAGRTFSVRARDADGRNSEMSVVLVANVVGITRAPLSKGHLRRFKRRWGLPPFHIIENDTPPFPKNIDLIGTNANSTFSKYYTISGPGVTQRPVGMLSVVRDTGMLRVHRGIDREEFPEVVFEARVFEQFTNKEIDLPLSVTVIIDDLNDNKPEFTGPQRFSVLEQSKAGTMVGMVGATDRDQEKTPHTKIKYSLLSGTGMFTINPETGVISTTTDQLDREVKDTHLVTVQIKDMDGAADGLSNTATATITLGDINDNPPSFTKTSYDVSIEENQGERLVLRIPVEDKDLKNTPNWNSQFVIINGDENGNFRMERDPKSNEGLLYLTKPLDYEKTKKVILNIGARNEAELNGTKAVWASIPVSIGVGDVDEGPEFQAPTVYFTVKENTPNGTEIGSYTALDPETKSGAGIKYYKTSDPASWIKVDMNSGKLRVANTIDRESSFVQDGIYNITMKAVDASSKTGTGTVVINVKDVNDEVPELPSRELVVCEKEGTLGSTLVTATDKDQPPYGAPFSFKLVEPHDGKWALNKLNDTAAMLEQTRDLPREMYEVSLEVNDLQGSGRVQTVHVRVCHCWNGACTTRQSTMSMGPLGILALLLPLILLLLLCLCLGFFCVTKRGKLDMDNIEDSGGVLLKSNIEYPGDEVDSNLIIGHPAGNEQEMGSVKGGPLSPSWVANRSASTIGGFSIKDNGMGQFPGFVKNTFSQQQYDSSQFGTGQFGTGQFSTGQFGTGQFGQFSEGNYDSSALHHTWLTNGLYLQRKLAYMESEAEGDYAEDVLHSYGFEGQGSPPGSVHCCSDADPRDLENLDFLNTLGPKFKTLAGVCREVPAKK